MHSKPKTKPVDHPACEVLANLAAAGTALEVARALGAWVHHGRLSAFAMWTLDSEEGPLRCLHGEGIDASVAGWDVLPRTSRSPLWRALDSNEDLLTAPLPAELDVSEIRNWNIHVLRGASGRRLGVVLCGCPSSSVPEATGIVLAALGGALDRAMIADAHAIRAGMFEHVAELMSDGLIAATPDGTILTYNPALSRMTGWTPEDVRDHGWTNLVYTDPAVRDEVQKGIVALMMGSPSEGIVRTLARKDGTGLKAAIWSRLQPHPSGFAPAMLGVIRDVTNERMARRRAIWEESHAQLGKLAGGVAHEFNNLLAAIMGHADLITLRAEDPTVRSHAETILRSAERGADLSTQLLAFSGSGNTQTTPVSVTKLLEQAVELFRPRVPAAVILGVEIQDDLPPVEVDPSQLQQVLMNLLANARDAVGAEGRITVTAELAPIPDNARYRSPYDDGLAMARIRVRDSGPGFTADALANLFVPFYSEKVDGHGVGLPAVRGVIGSHGGGIDVSNDHGAVVDLFLPISVRPELELPVLLRNAQGKGERVWVVDDQSAVLEFTHISLESQGYAVRSFSSVAALREALDGLRAEQAPSVVVLDVVMPDGGGAAAWESLREAGIEPGVIWTSGHTPDHLALPDTTGQFLQKPFTGAALAQLVARALEPH